MMMKSTRNVCLLVVVVFLVAVAVVQGQGPTGSWDLIGPSLTVINNDVKAMAFSNGNWRIARPTTSAPPSRQRVALMNETHVWAQELATTTDSILAWTPVGQAISIQSSSANDQLGYHKLLLNDNGSQMAVAISYWNSIDGWGPVTIRVYMLITVSLNNDNPTNLAEWRQMGQDLNLPLQAGDVVPRATDISWSNSGLTLAIGAIGQDNQVGAVSVLQYYGGARNEWLPVGGLVMGAAFPSTYTGLFTVVLSGDGRHLTIGEGNYVDPARYIRVYELRTISSSGSTTSTWRQMGILPRAEQGFYGESAVAMNANGTILVSGMMTQEEVHVYQYDKHTRNWAALGSPIAKPNIFTYGAQVEISSDGQFIAIGDGEGTMELYQLNGGSTTSSWEKLTEFGDSVAFFSIGTSSNALEFITGVKTGNAYFFQVHSQPPS